MYSNCCCSCSFEPEIINIGQLSHKMYSNNIVNCQESTIILNASAKMYGNLLKESRMCTEKVKRKKDMFICQCISTSIFCLNTKIFNRNYFCMRNDYDW